MNRAEAEEALALIQRVVGHIHDETIMQNRGRVMVVQGILDLMVFSVTQCLVTARIFYFVPYAVTWGTFVAISLIVNLRVKLRAGGTMTYVERHVWGNGLTFYTASFALVTLDCHFLGAPLALEIIPAHTAVIGAVAFAFMTLIDLRFFLYTAVFFVVAALVGVWRDYGFAVLGLTWFFCLVIPGTQYVAERKRLMATGEHTEII